MSIVLDEDQFFEMRGYAEAPGYQRMILSGWITQERSDGTYAAPLIPQLFRGVDGSQLQSWRQYIPSAGEHVILSRSGGEPSVPREELWWRKIRDSGAVRATTPAEPETEQPRPLAAPSPAVMAGLGLSAAALILVAWWLSRR